MSPHDPRAKAPPERDGLSPPDIRPSVSFRTLGKIAEKVRCDGEASLNRREGRVYAWFARNDRLGQLEQIRQNCKRLQRDEIRVAWDIRIHGARARSFYSGVSPDAYKAAMLLVKSTGPTGSRISGRESDGTRRRGCATTARASSDDGPAEPPLVHAARGTGATS